MEDIKEHFDLFKLRTSAGYTGKVSFSPFQAMTMYQYSNEYEYKNGIGAIPLTIGNIDLAWERTMNYNAGIDFSMFGKRLNVVVDAYIRNTTDLLLDKAKAPSTGVTTAKSNLGEMQNKGIEFQVDGYIFRNNDFSWKLGTSGYMNRNKITKINQALEEINKERAIILVSHDIGTILKNVKTIACVNETVHYHPHTEVPTEWLEEHFGCPIEMLGHGTFPHRVLKCHDHEH
jgi:outer membrane receptor for ferrienterochelin and colicin